MLSRWSALLAGIGVAACFLAAEPAAGAGPARAGQPAATRAVPAARLLRPGLRLSRPGVQLPRAGRQVGAGGPGGPPLAGGPQAPTGMSSNWSGYVASGGSYRKVTASWVQPQVSCPGGNQYASIWVGLDGFGNSGAVEQTGTEADCTHGRPRYYAWYELYPAYPVSFGSPVLPGDRVTGSVTAAGGGRYTLVISDATRGWSHRVTGTASRATNASAEVIVEAPSTGKGVLPLADFGTVSFTGATVNRAPLGSFRPALIAMVDRAGRARDIISPLAGGENFAVTWRHGK